MRRSATDLLAFLCLTAAVVVATPAIVQAHDEESPTSVTATTSRPTDDPVPRDDSLPTDAYVPVDQSTTTLAGPSSADDVVDPLNSVSASAPPTDGTTTTLLVDGSSARSSGETGAQTVVISDVAVAVADSGGNAATSDVVSAGAVQQLATGAATAIGSIDQTTITQGATIALADQATADLVQIAIVFNIGIAGANTGANALGTAGSGVSAGGTSTGNAVAVGNDAVNYLTQGATAAASTGATDSASQLTVTMHLGVAIANTGGNVVGGAAASMSTGSAVAVGNQSLTGIHQIATLAGSGDAVVSVHQQVLVLNLGVALANTGAGDVSGIAAALLTTPTQDIAAQLFQLLLPALAAAPSVATGSGTGATGNASATGNQSVTQVSQTASASASGTGVASVDQQVVVANVGAAFANTGLNGSTASVDMAAVQQLASFFAQLLQALQAWSSADAAIAQHVSFSVPLGDLMVALQGDFSGIVSSPTAGTTIHQLAAVISIGVSSANTGSNSTAAGAAAALGHTPGDVALATGDATAHNSSVVIVCQLDDSTATCLAPPKPPIVDPPTTPTTPTTVLDPASGGPTTSTASSPATTHPAGVLPRTGGGTEPLVPAATLLFLGLILVFAGRRRALR